MASATWTAASHESLIGPPSELIHINDFLRSSGDSGADVPTVPEQSSEGIDPTLHDSIASECSVDDIRSKVSDIFNDPRLYVYARRVHDTSVNTTHELAERNKSGKRKRKREVVSEPEDTPDLIAMKSDLANIKLKSWPLPQEAAVFIRGPKNSDINTLTEIKQAKNGSTPDPHSAVVTVSVYNRLTWSYNFVYRSSQHAVLSSNTLGELYNVIPCPSKELPDESTVDGLLVGGYVVVIEGTAYGDGLTDNDYASKLVAHTSKPLTIGSKTHETPFSSLSLRLNHPYWLVHHGNCEHFLVVDQIRLLHPHDPPLGTRLLRISHPHYWGTVSPCILCAPCWRNMGMPKDNEAEPIIIIPLPKYEFEY
ncbi:hypothetical protein BGY98DRAFT_1039103 [Russula aff. rugulosa BPL654]|nr:hypothetical protein BGY98DRAFT_1039103 [Russula aff. rugulosa BPL654]